MNEYKFNQEYIGMNKRELAILEKVFEAEIDTGRLTHLFQTKSKIAEKLVDDGMLNKRSHVIGGRFPVTIEGYELTNAGRFMYCDSCD